MKTDPTNILNIEDCEFKENLSTSYFCQEAEAVLLEENAISLIGSIDKIEIIGNKIYVLDGQFSKAQTV